MKRLWMIIKKRKIKHTTSINHENNKNEHEMHFHENKNNNNKNKKKSLGYPKPFGTKIGRDMTPKSEIQYLRVMNPFGRIDRL